MHFVDSWITLYDETARPYPIAVGHGASHPDAASEMGALLHKGLLEVGYVTRLLTEYGEDAVRKYLEARGFRGKLGKRVGDFGEVLAGAVICEHEALMQPITKLRYRERSDWPMRLTDVFTVRIGTTGISEFGFASVKSGITKPPGDIAEKGYEQLLDDARVEQPEILHFVCEQLFRQGQYDELTLFDDALNATDPVPKAFRLVLVFDASVWSDAVLYKLDELESILPGFKAYVVTIEDFRNLTEQAYEHAEARCFAT